MASVRHGDRREEETSVETEHRTNGTATEIVGFCFFLKPIGFNLCPNRSFLEPMKPNRIVGSNRLPRLTSD